MMPGLGRWKGLLARKMVAKIETKEMRRYLEQSRWIHSKTTLL